MLDALLPCRRSALARATLLIGLGVTAFACVSATEAELKCKPAVTCVYEDDIVAVHIPAAAIPNGLDLHVTAISDPPDPATIVPGFAVHIEPDTATLNPPAFFTAKVSAAKLAQVPGLTKAKLGIYKRTGGSWNKVAGQVIDSVSQSQTTMVTAGITGLGTYAVMGPAASVDPLPGAGDVVVLDYRLGGNKSMQGCTTLSCALGGAGTLGNVGFAANFDGAGTRALVFPWVKNNGQGSCTGNVGSEQDMFFFLQPNVTGPAEIFFQYKLWMGKTATGPGTGAVGSYTNFGNDPNAPGGHKWFVLFRTGNNDGRMTAEQGKTLGRFITTAYSGYSGPAAGADGSIDEVHFFGPDVTTPWNPDANINQVNTLTFRFKSESAANAHNGEMSLWINGVLRQEKTGLYTSPLGATEWQVGGPTWICPPQDQTAYIWDMLVWRK